METLRPWKSRPGAVCGECGRPLVGEYFFTCHFCGEGACLEHVYFHGGVHSEFEPLTPEGGE